MDYVVPVTVTVKGLGGFRLPTAFLLPFEEYGERWLAELLVTVFGIDNKSVKAVLRNERPDLLTVEGAASEEPQGEEVHLQLSKALWSRLGSSKVTFTLQDLRDYRSDEDIEHDPEQLDFTVVMPTDSFSFPRILTRIKLGPDHERWPRRFFVDLLGLSEKEYQAIQTKSRSALASMRQGIFSEVKFTEAGWDQVRKKKLSVKLYELLAGGPVAMLVKDLVRDMEVRVGSDDPFTVPRAYLLEFQSAGDTWLERALASLFGSTPVSVTSTDSVVEIAVSKKNFDSLKSSKVTFSLADLEQGPPEAQAQVEVQTPNRRFALPSSFVRTKLGSTHRNWCRRFFVDTLRLSEDTYRAIKADKDPGFARVRSTPTSLLIEFGDKGWARVKDMLLSLSLHDLHDASLSASPEEKEQVVEFEFAVEAWGVTFLLPAQYVRARLGPTPKTWARAFLADELRFSEQEYQGIKTGQRPDLARVMTDPRFVVVFGDEGWSKVKDKKLLSLSDIIRK